MRKTVFFMLLLLFIALGVPAFAADAAAPVAQAIPGWLGWSTDHLGTLGAGITGAVYFLSRYLLTKNKKITPDTPEGMAVLLFFWAVWKVVYVLNLYHVPPPVDLFNKPTGTTLDNDPMKGVEQ